MTDQQQKRRLPPCKSLPFGNIIGGPLVACVEAQAQAARTSWEFIQNVGLYADGEEKKTVNVSFQFIKDGRMAQITVPLLDHRPHSLYRH